MPVGVRSGRPGLPCLAPCGAAPAGGQGRTQLAGDVLVDGEWSPVRPGQATCLLSSFPSSLPWSPAQTDPFLLVLEEAEGAGRGELRVREALTEKDESWFGFFLRSHQAKLVECFIKCFLKYDLGSHFRATTFGLPDTSRTPGVPFVVAKAVWGRWP